MGKIIGYIPPLKKAVDAPKAEPKKVEPKKATPKKKGE